MAISEDVTFDCQNLKFEGLIDFVSDVYVSEHTNQLANHALLFSFRAFMSNWIQPIGVFAARGSTPGNVIQELMIKSITTHISAQSNCAKSMRNEKAKFRSHNERSKL